MTTQRQESVSAIYCDDIRQEMGGKLSFMGVYQADIIFPSFPAALPKLCVHVTLKFPYGEQPKQSLSVRLFRSDTVLAELTLDKETLQNIKIPSTDTDIPEEDRMLMMPIGFMLAPFEVTEPTRIKLRAYVDGEELKGNALRVRLPTPEEQQTNWFPPSE